MYHESNRVKNFQHFVYMYVLSISLFKYFKSLFENSLLSLNGNLSSTVLSSSLANEEVSTVLPVVTEHLAQSMLLHNPPVYRKLPLGIMLFLHRLQERIIPELRWSTVNDWKNAIIIQSIDASWEQELVDVVEQVSKI